MQGFEKADRRNGRRIGRLYPHCPSTAPLPPCYTQLPPAKLVCEAASAGQVAIGFLVRYLSMAVSAKGYFEATHHCRALPRDGIVTITAKIVRWSRAYSSRSSSVLEHDELLTVFDCTKSLARKSCMLLPRQDARHSRLALSCSDSALPSQLAVRQSRTTRTA